jgi:hypothetical protein
VKLSIKQTVQLSLKNMDMDEMDYFSLKRRRGSIDEDEERELEEYFNNYVPLSNRTLCISQHRLLRKPLRDL